MRSSNQIPKLYIHHMPADIPYDPRKLKYDKEHEAHSFIYQYLQTLFQAFSNTTQNMVDITATSRAIGPYASNYRCNEAGTGWIGIILGTVSTPPLPNDYKIQTKINHGAGAGQLSYLGMTFSFPWVAPPNVYAALQRIVQNASGAPITVTEVALYVVAMSANYILCVTRDILAAPATIQNGQAFRFIITFCTPVG